MLGGFLSRCKSLLCGCRDERVGGIWTYLAENASPLLSSLMSEISELIANRRVFWMSRRDTVTTNIMETRILSLSFISSCSRTVANSPIHSRKGGSDRSEFYTYSELEAANAVAGVRVECEVHSTAR